MKKRILSVLITVVMLIGMLPTTAFAVETTYNVWVGGVQVTSANKDDITTAITEAGGTADGTATYDPDTKTLTLNNFSYTGEGYEYDSQWCAAIFAKNDLTVKVVGSNTVTASVTDPYTAEALNVWGALTITGDSGSSLTLTGAGREGVDCGGNLKIENVTVNATGTSGLSSGEGNITINNAEVTATATTTAMQYDAAIYAYEGNITIENSTVTANAPHANAVYSYKSDLRYTIKNSNVTISAAKMGIGLTVGTRLFVENSTVEVTSDAGQAIVNDQNNFGAEPEFTGTHVVYAGDDAGSATEADASADATYANKYVKIEPVVMITKIEKTSTEGLVDTYTITYTDGTTTTFTVTNGEKGDTGAQGPQGVKGDTGAQGAQGEKGEKGDKGDKGDTGAQGPQGEKGNTGSAGADGVGIAKIEKTSSDGNVDTYTITLTNKTTYTFTVTNGTNGTDGKDGKDGIDGKDGTNGTNGVDGKDGANGTDGQTPYIGENGNWWIGDTDTGVKATGDDGKDGAIIAATAVGGTALISNIALIAWTLIKKKRLF